MNEQLPAFLRRRNGRLELVLHPTGVQMFKVCQLKFYLNRGLEIERAIPRWPLNYGGALHEALAFRYANLGLPLKTVEARQIELLTAWFSKNPVGDSEWRNLGRAVSAIAAYNAAYPAHEWTVLAVEEEFEIEVGLVRMANPDDSDLMLEVPVFLAGRKDLVVAWHDAVWVLDHKTCSEWGDDPEKNQELLQGRRSFQFRAYAWAERERQRAIASAVGEPPMLLRHRLPVRGVVGNYIVGRKPFSEADSAVKRRASTTTKPRDEHHQEFFPFDDSTLDEWREQFLVTAARVLHDWQAGVWEMSFDRGCAHYGKCEFYEYCEASPNTREAILLSSMFRKRETPVTTEETV